MSEKPHFVSLFTGSEVKARVLARQLDSFAFPCELKEKRFLGRKTMTLLVPSDRIEEAEELLQDELSFSKGSSAFRPLPCRRSLTVGIALFLVILFFLFLFSFP